MDARRPFPGTADDRERDQGRRYWQRGDYDPEQYEDDYGRVRARRDDGGRYPGAYGDGSAFGGGATPVGAGTYGDGGPYRGGDPASTRRGQLDRWRDETYFGGSYGRGPRERFDELDYQGGERRYDGGSYRERERGDDRGRFELGKSYAGMGPKGYRRSDDRIMEDVCDRLTMAGGVDAREIEVSVRDCEVYLKGTVTDRYQKRAAEDAAERVTGVRDVHNEVRVVSSTEGAQSQQPATQSSKAAP